jgi:hypothetical protein
MIARMANKWKKAEDAALLEHFKKSGRYCDVRSIELPGRSYAAKYQRLRTLVLGKWKRPSTVNRKLCKHEAGYKPLNYWTKREDALLLAQHKTGVPYKQMDIPGRTTGACIERLKKLYGGGKRMLAWTEAEVAELRRQYIETGYQSGIRIPGRKKAAILKKLQRLREEGKLL